MAPLLVGGILAACSSDVPSGSAFPVCPQIEQLSDTQRRVAFEGEGRDLTDVVYEVQLVDGVITCELDEDDLLVEAEFQIQFIASRGPADRERLAQFRYFVALLNRDQQVVAREEFGLQVPFEGNQTRVSVIDTVEPTIPLKQGETGRDYTLYVGLVLTREELEYNRRNRPAP